MRENRTGNGMGSGAFSLMLASAVFLGSSYVIHFWLGRYVGAEAYGTYGVILALMSNTTLLLTTGFPHAVSKYVAEDSDKLGGILRASTRLQLVICLVIFALYCGLAGRIANLLGDPGLTFYIRISALVIPFYAFSAIYADGYLNGLREFGKQAIAVVGSSFAKVAMVFALVLLGLGVKGAILGYLFAALVGLLLGWRLLGPVGRNGTNFDWKELARFGVPATLFAAMIYLVMNVDLYAVKAITVEDVDTQTGLYTAAATIAKVPYFIFGGLAAALLPSISRATADGDFGLTASYVNHSVRFMLLVLLPAVLIMSATSSELLSLVYGDEYTEAARPLSILVFGLALLTVFLVLSHMVMGSGRPGVVFVIASSLVAMDIALNVVLVPRHGLVGAAWATTLTGVIGTIAAAGYVLARFRALVGVRSVVKIGLASAAVYAVALRVSLSASFLPLVYVALFAVYFGLLVIMREFRREDVGIIKRMVPLARFGHLNK